MNHIHICEFTLPTPNLAICGGITEGRRIAALSEVHHSRLHFTCGNCARRSRPGRTWRCPAPVRSHWSIRSARTLLLRKLPAESIVVQDGMIATPTQPGLGVTLRQEFVER